MAALEASRPLDLADDESRDHAHEHEHGEHVDHQRVPTLRTEPWQGRMCVDRADHGDDDRGQEDQESPEDGRVHQARQQTLQQLALADHDGRLSPSTGGHIVESRNRLAGAQQSVEGPRPPREQGAGEHERDREGHGLDDDHLCLRTSAEMAGTISLRSPVTV